MKILQHGHELSVQVFDSKDSGEMFEFSVNSCGGNHGMVEIPQNVQTVTIKVTVPNEMPVYAYAMQYGANSHTDHISGSTDGGNTSFCRNVRLEWHGKERKVPQPPTNGGQSLRLLSVDQTGRLHDLVVSIVKQSDKLFVTVQETYNEQLYRAGDLIVCPPMEKTRFHTLEMVRQMLEGNAEFVASLPEGAAYKRPNLKKQAVNLRPGEGLVLWFADGMNSGSVLCRDGREHKVHFSRVLTVRQERRFLQKGEKVLFRGTEPIPGMSKFRDQLTDVTVEGMFPGLVTLNLELKPEDFQISN